MILDKQNLFSDAQDMTGTEISDNVMDMGVTNQRTGTGENLYFFCQLDTALTDTGGGNNATVTVTLEGDTQVGLDGTAEVILTLPVFNHGDAAGTRYIARLPVGYPTKRYLGVVYTVASGAITASFTSGLTHDVDAWNSYAKSAGAVLDIGSV